MVELYIVRHGETDTNYTGRINGSATDLSLNETGKKQVNYLKEQLNIADFDEIIASPLKRAQETAEILNQGNLKIQTDDRLREINYGDWDGAVAAEVEKDYPQCFSENGYFKSNYSDYTKNAETYQEVLDRLKSFLDDMAKKDSEKILVSCHGFVTRSFVQLVSEAPNIDDFLEVPNASVTKIKISDKTHHAYLGYVGRLESI